MRFEFLLLTMLLTVFPPVFAYSQGLASENLFREDGAWIFEDHYLGPNEFFGGYYEPALYGRKGAFIGVGSFRVLEAAVNGNFDMIVMVDYDKAVVEFNKLNIKLIRSSKNRHEYLMALLGSATSFPLLERVKSGRITEKTYFNKLLEESYSWDQVAINSNESINLRKFLTKERSKDGYGSLASTFRWQIKEATTFSNYFAKSMFGSDDTFLRVQEIIKTKRFIIANGNLAGRKTMADIASHLKRKKIEVSAIDTSNVLEYFSSGNEKLFKRFSKNLSNLPLAEDADLFFTIAPHGIMNGYKFNQALEKKVTAKDGWIYLAANANLISPEFGNAISDQDSLYRYAEQNIHSLRDFSKSTPTNCEFLLK